MIILNNISLIFIHNLNTFLLKHKTVPGNVKITYSWKPKLCSKRTESAWNLLTHGRSLQEWTNIVPIAMVGGRKGLLWGRDLIGWKTKRVSASQLEFWWFGRGHNKTWEVYRQVEIFGDSRNFGQGMVLMGIGGRRRWEGVKCVHKIRIVFIVFLSHINYN